MDNNLENELLEILLKTYKEEISNNRKIQKVLNKIKEGTADYTDSLLFAKESGKCLEKAFAINISDEVLPNSQMDYKLAKALIEPLVKKNYEIVSLQCASIQTSLNKKAKLGLKAIKPKYNEKKTDGIIKYISSAKVYSKREKSFLDALSTNSKAIVNEFVRQNADFHYNSGLSPKIIRTTNGKPCQWCKSLAGVYNYSKIRVDGNDVFKRHSNCNCIVVYDPSDGSKRVQDAWSKSWNDNSKLDKIQRKIERIQRETTITLPDGIEDVTKKYLSEATPGKGKIILDDDLKKEDIGIGEWLNKVYGGDIHLLQENKVIKWPDAYWKNAFWEFKTPISANSIDKRIRKAVSQLNSAKVTTNTLTELSGIVLDVSNLEVDSDLLNLIAEKFSKRSKGKIDLIVKKGEHTLVVLRSKKR